MSLVISCLLLSGTIVSGSETGMERSNPCEECTDLGLLKGVLVVKGVFDDCSESQSPLLESASKRCTGNVAYYRFNVAIDSTIVIRFEGVSNAFLNADAGASWSFVTSKDSDELVVAAVGGMYVLAVRAPLCSSASGPQRGNQYRMRVYSTEKVDSESGVRNIVEELNESEVGVGGHLAATGIGLLIPLGFILGIIVATALSIEFVCAISYCNF